MVTPSDAHYDSALDLVDLVRRRHRAGRPVRLALYDPAEVAAVLVVVAEVAALAVAELDRLRPDAPSFLDALRQHGAPPTS